jgi:hypothetical protein
MAMDYYGMAAQLLGGAEQKAVGHELWVATAATGIGFRRLFRAFPEGREGEARAYLASLRAEGWEEATLRRVALTECPPLAGQD